MLLHRIETSSREEEQLIIELDVWKFSTDPFAQPPFALKSSAHSHLSLEFGPYCFVQGLK